MKVLSITNHTYNTKFTGSAPINVDWRESHEPKKQNNNQPKSELPEWLRKSLLFGLIGLAVANDPATDEFFKSDDIKQQERCKNEYFEDVSKIKSDPIKYHLNRLGDVDNVIIKSKHANNYSLELNLDKQKINFDVNTIGINNNILQGYFKADNNRLLKYKAVFNPQNPDEFILHIRNKDNKQFIIGRKPNGELYRLEGKKKIVLNKENTQKYQNELKQLEELEDVGFFTNKNDLWRKLNLILLFLLTLNEWGHDLAKKERNKK